MRILYLYILMFLIIDISFSQTEFNMIYNDVDQIAVRKIFKRDNGFAIIGHYEDSTSYWNKIFINTIDSLGNLISHKIYFNDTMSLSIYDAIELDNGNYLVYGQGGNGNYYTNLVITLDNNFDTLYTKYIYTLPRDSLYSNSMGVEVDYDGGYLFVGQTNFLNNDSCRIYPSFVQLIKTDSIGNFLFRKTFFDTTKNTSQSAYYIKKIFGNGYMIGSWSGSNWQIIKLNNNYEVDEFRYYGNPNLRDNRMIGMITTSDSCVLLTGKYSLYSTNAYTQFGVNRVLKIDTNFNTVFDVLVGDTTHFSGFGSPTELCSGNFLFIENKEEYQAYYHKVSSTGELIMTKHIPNYDSVNYDNIAYNYVLADDNSAISAGNVFGWIGTDGDYLQTLWAVKMNNIGDNHLCETDRIEYLNKKNLNIIIYPNPTTGKITIESENIKKIEVYNINGVIIETTTTNTVNIKKQAKGLYFIKVITKEGTTTKKIILE